MKCAQGWPRFIRFKVSRFGAPKSSKILTPQIPNFNPKIKTILNSAHPRFVYELSRQINVPRISTQLKGLVFDFSALGVRQPRRA